MKSLYRLAHTLVTPGNPAAKPLKNTPTHSIFIQLIWVTQLPHAQVQFLPMTQITITRRQWHMIH